MANYSNDDYVFILKTLSKGVFEALDKGYDYSGGDIYHYLNSRLNRAVAKNHLHAKKLVAELMIMLNKSTNELNPASREINDAAGIDVFMSMIRNVVVKLINSFELTQNEIVVTDDGYPTHVVAVAYSYADDEWLITVTDQNMSDKHGQQYRFNGVEEAELSEDEALVMSLLGAITSLMSVEKETELMVSAAAANSVVVEKAKEIQRVFGKSYEEHLEMALIFHDLTNYSPSHGDDAQRMAAYIKKGGNCTPEQALTPAYLEAAFGFNQQQSKSIAKIFGKQKAKKPLGWKLFGGGESSSNKDVNEADLGGEDHDIPKKDGDE